LISLDIIVNHIVIIIIYQNNIVFLLEMLSKRDNVEINYWSLILGQLVIPKHFIGTPGRNVQNRYYLQCQPKRKALTYSSKLILIILCLSIRCSYHGHWRAVIHSYILLRVAFILGVFINSAGLGPKFRN